MLGLTAYSHEDLETLLAGYDVACHGRRQRALKGLSPEMVLRQRPEDKPDWASPPSRPTDPTAIERALEIAAAAKEVSQPDTLAAS